MSAMDGWLKVFAWSCTHHPLADPEMTAWRLEQLREYAPDVVVNLGDWMDADAASRWPNEHRWTLDDEYVAVALDADAVRKAAPKAQLVWLWGNHDENLRAPNRVPEKLRKVASWEAHEQLNAALSGWKMVPYSHRSLYRIGQVTFQHGAEAGINADRNQCLLYGVDQGLWIGGHTHRPVAIQQVILPGKIPLSRWYGNVGCGADWTKMQYVQRSNIATWGQAVLKVRVNAGHRRHVWAGRQWAADPGICVLKMAHGG